jgi:hypothetical protein
VKSLKDMFNNFRMFRFVIYSYVFFVFYSCTNSSNEKELEIRERELALKERELEMGISTNSPRSHERSDNNRSQNQNNSNSGHRVKTESDLRNELESKEKRNPKTYLSVDYDLNYRLFSGKDEIKGTIYNSATMATFKDVILTVTYSSNTGTKLYSENFVVYDFIYPGSSTDFNIKTYSPEGTKQIGVKIKSASTD